MEENGNPNIAQVSCALLKLCVIRWKSAAGNDPVWSSVAVPAGSGGTVYLKSSTPYSVKQSPNTEHQTCLRYVSLIARYIGAAEFIKLHETTLLRVFLNI